MREWESIYRERAPKVMHHFLLFFFKILEVHKIAVDIMEGDGRESIGRQAGRQAVRRAREEGK